MSPKAKKIFIALFVVGGLSLVGCLVCAVSGASSFTSWAGQMRQQGQQNMADADRFAASHDQTACVAEGRRRDDVCGPTDISCQAQAGVFLQRCLDQAIPTPGFCDGVPPQTEIVQSAQWAISQCVGQPHDGGPCRSLMQSVQRHCDAARRH